MKKNNVLYENIMRNVSKSVKKALNENLMYADFVSEHPTLYRAIKQFVKDKNLGDDAIEVLIASWTDDKAYNEMNRENRVIPISALHEFDTVYLMNVDDDEISFGK